MKWFWIGVLIFGVNNFIFAYPENVRRGYASCASCHISPTGGGLTTSYGEHAAEEFLNTWKLSGDDKEEKNELEDPLRWGGNVRAMGYILNNGLYKSKGVVPMQIEGEAAYKFWGKFTANFSAGIYETDLQTQRFYLLANLTEHFYARIGKFFPAYGIMTEQHSTVIRKGIGFNEGRESVNLEAGLMGETGEIVVDGIIDDASDENISSGEHGFTVRTAWYAGGRSQLGASFLRTTGRVWQRTMSGLFAIAGLTKTLYLLSEVDQEFKTPTDTKEISTPGNTRVLTYNKLGWEFFPGMHSFVTYESSVNTNGAFDPRIGSYGPGVQWFPVEHLDLLAQWQKKYNSAYPNQPGTLANLVVHYYF